MDETQKRNLELLSNVGVALDKNGNIHDNLGNPAGRRGSLGSEAPGRHRTTFTEQDDHDLSEWVQKAEGQGLRINIKVFEDIESINPRHTALSWQAQWKKLRNKSNPPSNTPGIQMQEGPLLPISITTTPSSPRSAQKPLNAEQEASPPSDLQMDDGNTSSADQRHKLYQVAITPPPNTIGRAQYHANCQSLNINGGQVTDEATLRSRNTSLAQGACIMTNTAPIITTATTWDLPEMPTYPVIESRVTPGQIRGKEWMSVEGRLRFEAQEAQLLSRWGVTPKHAGTCVLVPLVWSDLDPAAIINTFNLDAFSQLDDARLTFSMLDHSTTWVRTASWFRASPHNGMEFDNFLGSGPFRPMEGSHLCHHGHCLNPFHLVYEDYRTNKDRNRCRIAAQEIRALGLPIPKHCIRHKQEPCLLQHAALTEFEVYLIQLSIAAQARGFEYTAPTSPPADHPYSTFESKLPLSFAECAVTLDPANLTTPVIEPLLAEPRPTFQCVHCSVARTFRSLPGFWAHIRDGHPLVPESTRIGDIIRAGRSWQGFTERNCTKGIEIDIEDGTWKQVEQMKQADFDWSVVQGWKLAYNRKRKFGKEIGSQSEAMDSAE